MLVEQCVRVHSRPLGTWDMCAVLSGGAWLSETADGEGNQRPLQEALQVHKLHSTLWSCSAP